MIVPEDKRRLATALCEAIMRTQPDPGAWLFELRRFAEKLHLRPERCIPLGRATLAIAAWEVIDEAAKQGRSAEEIERAMGER